MKLLALCDRYIQEDVMLAGLSSLTKEGIELHVRTWQHPSLEALQHDNLRIEQHGPDAVTLPDDVYHDIEQFDVLVVHFAPVTAAILQRAQRLKMIGILRGGMENVDRQAAQTHGITLLNTPGRNAQAVAEFTLGLLLTETRNIARAHAAMKQGTWLKDFPNRSSIRELAELTVGIAGFGNIGRRLAHYLQAIGSTVLVYDDYTDEIPAPFQAVDRHTLLTKSDVITLHLRLSEHTHHFIGASELALMKPSSILINTARSGLIDEAALIHSLQTNEIQGAALDVFDAEPLPPQHPFLALPNVTLTSHLAGSTADAFINSPKQLAEMLRSRWQEC
ncbi:D-isomer specific 2-hydroxyacid dehydrogenase, NAD binding domain protein [Fictibacillus macauensis ZFHKF-1]|uniref:D-isomer specific 2-hydroxyacid dehydrogenase, NAD binding domain protein n=1 Tax=Fictibacillus macauensis ZFHKF-1 TaxID=1196324 RepID=I8UBX3_9BACL|nr:2-hydroxyacid dehydrogenase [Fictibacillus macauensis]EIT84293.1 D-isomer specific 2-hydroxyacid dehydrogenase, NAD binding domain protein [Fictibacillus macauensis ZFHKF-1]